MMNHNIKSNKSKMECSKGLEKKIRKAMREHDRKHRNNKCPLAFTMPQKLVKEIELLTKVAIEKERKKMRQAHYPNVFSLIDIF